VETVIPGGQAENTKPPKIRTPRRVASGTPERNVETKLRAGTLNHTWWPFRLMEVSFDNLQATLSGMNRIIGGELR